MTKGETPITLQACRASMGYKVNVKTVALYSCFDRVLQLYVKNGAEYSMCVHCGFQNTIPVLKAQVSTQIHKIMYSNRRAAANPGKSIQTSN